MTLRTLRELYTAMGVLFEIAVLHYLIFKGLYFSDVYTIPKEEGACYFCSWN